MKECGTCGFVKNRREFSRDVTKPDGLRSTCRLCDRETKLRYRYGIGLAEYTLRLAEQGNVCDICRASSADMVVDHDHACCPGERSCGKCLRGIVCQDCNRAIGLLREDQDVFASAIMYLQRFEKEEA